MGDLNRWFDIEWWHQQEVVPLQELLVKIKMS